MNCNNLEIKMNNQAEQIFLLTSSENQPSNSAEKMNEISAMTPVNLENVEDFSNVCRTCATITEFVIPIFSGEGLQNNLAEKINKYLPIQVCPADTLPRVVCCQCAGTLLACHELAQCCRHADRALRTRLAARASASASAPAAPLDQNVKSLNNDEDQNEDKEQQQESKFKEIADFVVRTMSPPQYVEPSAEETGAGDVGDEADERGGEGSGEEAGELRACGYCGARLAPDAYTLHLVSAHSRSLFHCDECGSYVDRKDFIVHMSLHTAQYASSQAGRARLSGPNTDGTDGTDGTDERSRDTIDDITEIDSEKVAEGDDNIVTKVESIIRENLTEESYEAAHGNEFSDHSDTEYAFGPLPESVFEAIEDSQDSQPGEEVDDVSNTQDDDGRSESHTVCDSVREPSPPPPPPEPPETTNQKENEKKHKKIRTCPICAKVYNASSSYFYHMRYFHRRVREHECDVCGRKFATRASLSEHVSIHTGVMQLECKHCGKKFRSKASLYIHEQTHNGVKSYACTQCQSSFRWRTHLERHMKRHSAEKSHVCTTCGRGFAIHCDLLRHMRTHTAGNFTCEKCGAKFAQQRYLKVHMDNKHSTIITNEKNSTVVSDDKPT